jgi:hypothetical protein
MSENAPYNPNGPFGPNSDFSLDKPSDSFTDGPFGRKADFDFGDNKPKEELLPWESASSKTEEGTLPWETVESKPEEKVVPEVLVDNEPEKDSFAAQEINIEENEYSSGLNIEFGKIPDKGYVLKIPGGGVLAIGNNRADAYTLFDLAISEAANMAGDTLKERGSALVDLLEPHADKILEYEEKERDNVPIEKLTSFQALKNRMSESGSTFMSKLRGEHVPDTSKEPEPGKKDAAKYYSLISKGVLSGLATMSGIKGAYDVPAWFYQKYVTTVEEKRRLEDSFKFTEVTGDEESYLAQRADSISSAVDESKFLSPEQKTDLKNKIKEIADQHEKEIVSLEFKRNQEVFKLVDDFIQTRVKGTVALKEGVNSALKFTAAVSGASAALALGRSGTYLSVSLFERAKKVQKEIKEGERSGKFIGEYLKGFGETWDNLNGGKGKDWKEKSVNIAKAAGTITRVLGFGSLAGSAIGESIPDDMFDKMLLSIPTGKEVADSLVGGDVVQEAVEGSAEVTPETEIEYDEEEAVLEPEPEVAPEVVTEPEPEIVPEVAAEPEAVEEVAADAEVVPTPEAGVSQEQLELATIKSGDGIIRIAQRQLEADPTKFGYEGDVDDASAVKKWVRKTAFAAAKKNGFINSDGWTGIGGKGIDKVAIVISNNDGEINFGFADAQTGEELNVEDLEEQRIIRDYVKPAEAEPAPEQAPAETLPLIEKVYEGPDDAVPESEAVEEPDSTPDVAPKVAVPAESAPEPKAVDAAPVSAEGGGEAKANLGSPEDSGQAAAEAVKTANVAPDADNDAPDNVTSPVLDSSDAGAEVAAGPDAGNAAEAAAGPEVKHLGGDGVDIKTVDGHVENVGTTKGGVSFSRSENGKIEVDRVVRDVFSVGERPLVLQSLDNMTRAEFEAFTDNTDNDQYFNKVLWEYSAKWNALEAMASNDLATDEMAVLQQSMAKDQKDLIGALEKFREAQQEAAPVAAEVEVAAPEPTPVETPPEPPAAAAVEAPKAPAEAAPAETPAEASVIKSGDGVEIARTADGGIEQMELKNNADNMKLTFNRGSDGKFSGFSFDGNLTDYNYDRINSVVGDAGFSYDDLTKTPNVNTSNVMTVGFLKEMSSKLVAQGLANSEENLALEKYVSAQENMIVSALKDPTLVIPELKQTTVVDNDFINKLAAKAS